MNIIIGPKSLFTSNTEKARTIIYKPVFKYRLQCFRNIRYLSTAKKMTFHNPSFRNNLKSIHLIALCHIHIVHPKISDTELANFSPVGGCTQHLQGYFELGIHYHCIFKHFHSFISISYMICSNSHIARGKH